MSLLEHELAKLATSRLRELAADLATSPTVRAAAEAELTDRHTTASAVRILTDDQLRAVTASGVPSTAAAAQAELDARPAATAVDGEAWIREVFPQRPSL